ncbi:TadE/TadG family type IV pilus assembly protein [Aeromicrobium sp. IC_218]|uniref:TadE/TadG family type IV pilus assembly protein n=1 Tax=Aeromicrobium sp. IC_218 TaxID=2545468 RepID=UPI00103C3E2B|nr:TadE/TadG family type IV pilus assembly protein [Aeromicrobium sp. IC_218]TCI95992.1 pilus assembly protein [Aeromicrobium sp. IC_218]
MPRARDERGSAVVDFVLVMLVLVPLVLGVMQVALVLHVRNTLEAAATEGARVSASLGATPADGSERARQMISTSIADRFARDVTAARTSVGGLPATVVRAQASVPPLGLWGPGITVEVEGRALAEVEP